MPVESTQSVVPLCVDLDGTLIRTDLLWESLVRLLKQSPFSCLLVPFWWLRGRAFLKAQIAARVQLDTAALPYNTALVEYLRGEKARGRPLLLVTASDESLAREVGVHLGLFSDVLASNGKDNLRGKTKGAVLAQRFGDHGFDYAGNSSVDLPVWAQAREAIVVNGGSRLANQAAALAKVSKVFGEPKSPLKAVARALRPHQWVKNLIIFVPLLTSHQLGNWPLVLGALVAFVSFSLCASGVYVLNDLLDLDADRHHPTKRFRSFASGELALPVGLALFPSLLVASVVLATQLPWGFAVVLAIYVVLTTSYSWRLKEEPLLDVFCLAGLYTIRLLAGHEATKIAYSFWLLVFSMFIFLSLALVKRYVELHTAQLEQRTSIKRRGYLPGDIEFVATLGPSSGYLAVLVLGLYVNSQEVRVLYTHPTLLLLVCPLLLYWISRVWLLAHRDKMHHDPVVFALRDPASYLVGVLTLAVLWLATGH